MDTRHRRRIDIARLGLAHLVSGNTPGGCLNPPLDGNRRLRSEPPCAQHREVRQAGRDRHERASLAQGCSCSNRSASGSGRSRAGGHSSTCVACCALVGVSSGYSRSGIYTGTSLGRMAAGTPLSRREEVPDIATEWLRHYLGLRLHRQLRRCAAAGCCQQTRVYRECITTGHRQVGGEGKHRVSLLDLTAQPIVGRVQSRDQHRQNCVESNNLKREVVFGDRQYRADEYPEGAVIRRQD